MAAIIWYENPALDAPELNSPQPCIHGAGCVFTVTDAHGQTVPGVCRFVHPGEEGKGRRLFPERTIRDTGPDGTGKVVQPACVRLIGGADYYERRRLKMPWQMWCAHKGIAFTPNKPGERHEPVKRVPIGGGRVVVGAPTPAAKPVLNAVAKADQSWPVLGGVAARVVDILEETPEEAAEAATEEAVAAERKKSSAAFVGPLGLKLAWSEESTTKPEAPRTCECKGIWHNCSEIRDDIYELDEETCDDCGKSIHLCYERGDHGDEKRDFARMYCDL
jgi:hypothetical protein